MTDKVSYQLDTGAPPSYPINPREAGVGQHAGWLSPEGRFYPCERWGHIRLAARLRAMGSGPTEPWNMRDGWVEVKANGTVLALPGHIRQAQLNVLMDMLLAAPSDSSYRSWMHESLRELAALEAVLS